MLHMMLLRYMFIVVLVLVSSGVIQSEEVFKEERVVSRSPSTDIAEEVDDRLLLFATLDGTLAGIEQQSGKIRWRIKEKPIVQVPLDLSDAIVPVFLPDPTDGSLYVVDNSGEPLKKLPFTIPQLVSTSPCRSSDGILYTGKKKDTWFKLDPVTGNKEQIVGWDENSNTQCPVDSQKSIYIGRTKYNIKMFNGKNVANKWNVTFYMYAAADMSKEELNDYDLVHFTSTSSGKLITLNRRRGNLLWDDDLGSPVVGIYLLDPEGLISVPFTSLANHTINYLSEHLGTHDGLLENSNHMKLYPTLYIGEHVHGLYATRSLVDQNVVTITASDSGPLLLGGPHAPDRPKLYYFSSDQNYFLTKDFFNEEILNYQNLPIHVIIFTGHYNVPQFSSQKLISTGRDVRLITDESSSKLIVNDQEELVAKDGDIFEAAEHNRKNLKRRILSVYTDLKLWINQQENKGLKLTLIILSGCVIAMFWYLQIQVREMAHLSQTNSHSSQKSSSSHVTAISEDLSDGLERIGKITFHPEQLLGKGCEGTFVYRGEFDNRRVAVKRLLPECFTFADREVSLLRESDAHPHVIRYFCMEQDRMFRYIALELCQATLSDYIEGRCNTSAIEPLEILKQATLGLAHLHSLDIVHRDIKPHNVLISLPNNKGEVKAMISDFGLCKKLQVGKVSFSRRSGVTGTDGWIAPEMLNGTGRTTCAVDLFSLGCLYYYVLSHGSHPFGDSLRRQANILIGEFTLSELKGAEWRVNLQIPLLSALISSKPEDRPSCNAVLQHPIFWSYSKILSFFQDVSDRIEKAEAEDFVLQSLEGGGEKIVKLDWRAYIHEEVATDLRRYRSYYGDSVRDLLRALRNKKHHFRELSREAQKSLGDTPEAFTNYWTTRFPLLLVHTWIMMQCVANEATFKNYYHETHRYSVEQFKDQVECYFSEYPLTLPRDNEYVTKSFEEDMIERKKPMFKKYVKIVSNKQTDRRVKYNLPQSGGLYRNLVANDQNLEEYTVDEETSKISTKKTYLLKKKPKTKRVDEPLVWATNDK